ncbi:hypothetical protein H632_c1498p1, partial [Helicosporidium sp. ATCC 50920]
MKWLARKGSQAISGADFRSVTLCRFKIKADIMLPDGTISLGASCKDTLFRGRISLDMPTRALLYRKKFDMPNGMVLAVDGGVQVVDLPPSLERGSGGWWPQRASSEAAPRADAKPWDPLVQRVKPFLGVQLLVGASGKSSTALLGDGGVLVRREIPIPRPIVGASWPHVAVK